LNSIAAEDQQEIGAWVCLTIMDALHFPLPAMSIPPEASVMVFLFDGSFAFSRFCFHADSGVKS
jgi:hypothetical protein